jgi:hypothetical protein
MRQHGSSFIGHIKNITMTFLTLVVFKRSIRFLALQLVVVPTHIFRKMNKDIFYSMSRFCIKKFEGVMGSRQMAVHAIRDKSLFIVDMS